MPADFSSEVLVHCPSCDRRATIDDRSGTMRLTCPQCGLVRDSGFPGPGSVLHVYGSENTIFGARLSLETECCGGRRLWALNPDHLDYLERFVAERQRTRAFPSAPGSRQLGDYLPT
ncbi:MAG TPA: hypothetical protein VF101_00265, partial [Gaiellaceae bacterium]